MGYTALDFLRAGGIFLMRSAVPRMLRSAANQPGSAAMRDILDLDRYPIDQQELPAYSALVQRCQADLAAHGMFNLHGFVRRGAIEQAAAEILPLSARRSYPH